MRRLVPVLLAGVLALAGAFAPSALAPAVAAAGGPKIVLIVGATHSATDSYRADMDEVYATALTYSSNVVKVYSPNATWAAVEAAIQGASVVVYMGHGNGFPSPYLSTLWPDRMDGFGLNAVAGQGDSNTTYYGESYIASSVKLAPNAVVILAHLCYASGNSEPGLTPPTLAVAEARIDNFAAGFIEAGARAVIADAHADTSWYVDQLFTTHQTFDQLFRTKPWGSGNTFTFPSTRTPGYTAYADPDVASPPADFYRSMVTQPTLRTDDVTGATAPGDAGVVPLTVPGAAEVTGAGGVGLFPNPTLTPDPATGGASAILPDGTRLHVLASAPGPSGGLAYQVATLDGTRAGYVGPAGLTPVDATPPSVRSLMVSPGVFSPTSGGAVTVDGAASKAVDWSIAILDRAGATVAAFTGNGSSLSVTWSGRTATGQVVPDGSYAVVATASDPWGNPPATARTTLAVDGTPPSLALSGTSTGPTVLSPNGDGINDTARIAFTLSERATVVAAIRDGSGAVVQTITAIAAAGSRAISWNGMGATGVPAPDGSYTFELSARDAAGNASPTISVPIVVATARSQVAATPAWISPTSRGPDPRASTLSFALARPASVTWQVTTSAGVPVRTWYVDTALAAGAYAVRWDGRSDAGALVPSGRYLSRVMAADGVTTTTEQTPVYSGGIRILVSDTAPAAGQTVTITIVAIEAFGANPSVWVTQPGLARFGSRAVKVGASTYRAQVRLRVGPAGPVTFLLSGIDGLGRVASASVSYRLH